MAATKPRAVTAKQLQTAYKKYVKAMLKAGMQPMAAPQFVAQLLGELAPPMGGSPVAAGIATVQPNGLSSSIPGPGSVPSRGSPNIAQLLSGAVPAVASALGIDSGSPVDMVTSLASKLVGGDPFALALSSPIAAAPIASSLPTIGAAVGAAAPLAIAAGAIGIPIAALLTTKSEAQLRAEAAATGAAQLQAASAAAFDKAAAIAPIGSPAFQELVRASTVQNLGEIARKGHLLVD
jgi:hypothetical protein